MDVFFGGGTSFFKGLALERIVCGIDVNKKMVGVVEKEIKRLFYGKNLNYFIFKGDAVEKESYIRVGEYLRKIGKEKVDFVFLHPPYFRAISYSDDERDLSNCETVDEFYERMEKVIDNVGRVLKKGGYCVMVIGDVFIKREVELLGFKISEMLRDGGFKIRSVVVKNVRERKNGLWEARALRSDYYNFNHEYVFVYRNG